MRSLPLVLLALAALLAPMAAVAADPTNAPSRAFVITGLELGGRTVQASGKLSIEGGRLTASVGCNTIGGKAILDGDRLTIPEPLVMTAMACLGADSNTEAMLIKILQAGPFTISRGAWTASNAAILVDELPSGPGPGASVVPPDDGVVSSSLKPGAVEPAASCPPQPNGVNGASPADGGPDSGSGGATAGSAGGSTSGSAGSGGSTGTGSGPAATAIDLPLATTIAEPAGGPGTPGSEPGATAGVGTEPGIGTDPGVGKPVASDPCSDRLAALDRGYTGGAGIEPPKNADAAAEHSSSLADASALVPVGLGLVLVLVIGFVAIRRARAGRLPKAAGGGPSSAG